MNTKIRLLLVFFFAFPFSISAEDISASSDYAFKVFADEELFWEGHLVYGDEIETKKLGLPGMPKCYSQMPDPRYAKVFCAPSLRIMRGQKAREIDASCTGFLLVENYISHWEKTKANGNVMIAPATVTHHMCIANTDNVSFTDKTTEGWLKQTTYRVEMVKQ